MLDSSEPGRTRVHQNTTTQARSGSPCEAYQQEAGPCSQRRNQRAGSEGGEHGVIAAELEDHGDDMSFPMTPQKIVWDLRRTLGATDIVISDVGAHKLWMARLYEAEAPNTCIISNWFASMGIALPGAIAAKLVHPERKAVAVGGDAGFMMNSQELETALRLGLDLVVLIWRDDKYGLIEWHQNRKFGRASNIAFTNPDFVKFSESFGARGYRVESAAELEPVLKAALSDGTVSVIDCPVDYSENMKLTEKLGNLQLRI